MLKITDMVVAQTSEVMSDSFQVLKKIYDTMEQSHSWEADSHSTGQEIFHRLLRDLKGITMFTRSCQWTLSWTRW